MAKMAAILLYVTFVTFLFASVSLSAAEVCLVAPNSTSPTGYFEFQNWFPTPKAASAAGNVTGSDLPKACGKLCVNSKYGFYIRAFEDGQVFGCYCLNGAPDYTKPEPLTGVGYFAKKCPKVKGSPPPPIKKGPPPPSPPPPYTPKACADAYNSTNPSGFFYIQYIASLANAPPYVTNATSNSVDVWPQQGSTLRCSKVCKGYKWGFYVTFGKYTNDANCYCLKSALTYVRGGSGSYGVLYYSKSCSDTTGHHPPGTGHHPPGVGHHQ